MRLFLFVRSRNWRCLRQPGQIHPAYGQLKCRFTGMALPWILQRVHRAGPPRFNESCNEYYRVLLQLTDCPRIRLFRTGKPVVCSFAFSVSNEFSSVDGWCCDSDCSSEFCILVCPREAEKVEILWGISAFSKIALIRERLTEPTIVVKHCTGSWKNFL